MNLLIALPAKNTLQESLSSLVIHVRAPLPCLSNAPSSLSPPHESVSLPSAHRILKDWAPLSFTSCVFVSPLIPCTWQLPRRLSVGNVVFRGQSWEEKGC